MTIPPTTATKATVTDCVGNQPQARPSTLTLACGDDGVVVTGVTWLSWGGPTANGMGQLGEDDCGSTLQPCTQGKFVFEPASIVLGDLASTAHGSTYRSVSVKPLPPNPGHFTAHSGWLPG